MDRPIYCHKCFGKYAKQNNYDDFRYRYRKILTIFRYILISSIHEPYLRSLAWDQKDCTQTYMACDYCIGDNKRYL